MNIYTGLLFTCLVTVCAGAGNSTWDYNSLGSDWPKNYEYCGGKRQSPVDIKDANCSHTLKNSITFTNYDQAGSEPFKFENNGHSVVLSTSTTGAKIKLGTLGTFTLVQLHFHWGKDNEKGSEHTLEGKAYPAEMHLVHKNDKYSTLGEAIKKGDGLAVLGVFIKVGEKNSAYEFLKNTSSITKSGKNTTVNPFAMKILLPENRNIFYRYLGSLTTPTCDEAVIWTVFKQEIELDEDQLNQFRILQDSKNKSLVDNYRSVLDIGDRPITYWDDDCPVPDGAEAITASIFSLLLSFLLFTLN